MLHRLGRKLPVRAFFCRGRATQLNRVWGGRRIAGLPAPGSIASNGSQEIRTTPPCGTNPQTMPC